MKEPLLSSAPSNPKHAKRDVAGRKALKRGSQLTLQPKRGSSGKGRFCKGGGKTERPQLNFAPKVKGGARANRRRHIEHMCELLRERVTLRENAGEIRQTLTHSKGDARTGMAVFEGDSDAEEEEEGVHFPRTRDI